MSIIEYRVNPHPKIAAIDVGSNTLRLLVVEITGPHRYRILYQEQAITRLGEGLGGVGADLRVCPSKEGEHIGSPLQDTAMSRSLTVLKHFAEKAREYGVEEILAVGTRALREASNGQAFADMVKQEAGYPLRIIDGEHEARLALLGVFGAIPHLDKIFLVDIGGGSTEFTLAQKQRRQGGKATGRQVGAQFIAPEVIWSHSTDLGVVRLLEQYLRHDPSSPEERTRLTEFVKERIKNVGAGLVPAPQRAATRAAPTLVGTAGTYTTLAALEQEMEIYDPAKINGYFLTTGRLNALEEKLYALSLKERKNLKGLEAGRADVILPGATLARVINEVFGYEQVVVSDGGLREGIVWEWMEKAANRQ